MTLKFLCLSGYTGTKMLMYVQICSLVNCFDPSPVINGSLGDYNNTMEGTTFTYQCDKEFIPIAVVTSTCSYDGLWTPAPENHNCTFVVGTEYAWSYAKLHVLCSHAVI